MFIDSRSLVAAERERTAAGAVASELQMRELLLASRVLQRAIRACLSLDAAFLAHLAASTSSRTRTLERPPALRACCSSYSNAQQTQTQALMHSAIHYTPHRPSCPLCPTIFTAGISGAGGRGRSGCSFTQAAASQQQRNPRASLRSHYAQMDAAFAAVGRELLTLAGTV